MVLSVRINMVGKEKKATSQKLDFLRAIKKSNEKDKTRIIILKIVSPSQPATL